MDDVVSFASDANITCQNQEGISVQEASSVWKHLSEGFLKFFQKFKSHVKIPGARVLT
jgi:hypothetical protein